MDTMALFFVMDRLVVEKLLQCQAQVLNKTHISDSWQERGIIPRVL